MWIFSQLLKKEKDISKLLTDISSQQEKHQRLQETKAALDMEIAVYKKLLETEEDRLDIGQGETDHYMNIGYNLYFRWSNKGYRTAWYLSDCPKGGFCAREKANSGTDTVVVEDELHL